MRKAIIVDIDGTVAEKVSDRSYFDYHRVHEDAPIPHVIEIVRALSNTFAIIFVTGRDEDSRDVTAAWLAAQNLSYDLLLMRPIKYKYAKDSFVKRLLYQTHIEGQYEVLASFDDRNQSVEGWRELGVPCWQVRPGDY